MKILYGSGNILVSPQMGGGASTQIIGFVSNLEKFGHHVDLDISGEQKLYPQVRTKTWLNYIRQNIPLSWLVYELLQIANNLKIRRRLQQINISSYDLLWQRYELFTTAYAECAHAAGLPNILFVDAPLINERETYSHLWLKHQAHNALKTNVAYADRVVAVSEQIAAYIRETIGNYELSVRVIPNGFSEHILEVNSAAIQQIRADFFNSFSGMTIGFVGSPMTWHRLDYLVRVAHRLSQERKDFRVLIVGDGPDLPTQEKLVNELGITEFVKFTGNIPFADIAPYLQVLDIGVMPDSNLYGSPMKITEYMACGAVVVAPDLPPIAEFCQDEVDGLLFPKDDVEALYNRIFRLLDSPNLWESLRQHAKGKAIANYTWSARIAQLEDLFKEITKTTV